MCLHSQVFYIGSFIVQIPGTRKVWNCNSSLLFENILPQPRLKLYYTKKKYITPTKKLQDATNGKTMLNLSSDYSCCFENRFLITCISVVCKATFIIMFIKRLKKS